LSANQILTGCYSELNAGRCALITRDSTGAVNGNRGEISNIDSRNQNFLGGLETDGFDFGLSYRYNFGDWGMVRTRLDNTYVTYFGDLDKPDRGQLNRDGDISSGNVIGSLPAGSSAGAPRHRLRSQLSTTWSIAQFESSVTLEYRSRVNEACNNINNTALALGARDPSFLALRDLCSDPTRIVDTYRILPGTTTVVATPTPSPRNQLGGVTYTHLQGSYKAPWDGVVTLGIRNLFDKQPPLSSDAFANSYDAQYLIPGRFYYLSYVQKF
jgi:iron complex outermembrane recepter protein